MSYDAEQVCSPTTPGAKLVAGNGVDETPRSFRVEATWTFPLSITDAASMAPGQF